MANVDWLLRRAMSEPGPSLLTSVDDEEWRADIERIEIGDWLRVYLTKARIHRDIALQPRDDSQRRIVSQVTIDGRAELKFKGGGRTYTDARQALLFRSAQEPATYRFQAGTRFHSVGYSFATDHLAGLFDGTMPPAFAGLLRPAKRACLVAMPAGRQMRGLAARLFASGLNGPLRHLMLEGLVLQLLALQAAAALPAPRQSRRAPLSRAERDAIHEARRVLLADMRTPPSLRELATRVGLSEKRLGAGFRAVYGTTAYTALRNERLEHARLVLETGRLSLKEVAFRVGYNHVANFVTAFTARYGQPPRSYARGARAAG